MREIKEYMIIMGNVDFVTARIKVLIEKGWQPYGSPYYGGFLDSHCQAVVKYKEENLPIIPK